MNSMNTLSLFTRWGVGALLAMSLSTGCGPQNDVEPIALVVERTEQGPRFSWEGEKVHKVEVLQCDTRMAVSEESCSCSGTLAWGLGAADTESFYEVASQAPFIASPLEYGVRPQSDRKNYSAQPLVQGSTYLARVVRVAPCDDNAKGCDQVVAEGCKTFVW